MPLLQDYAYVLGFLVIGIGFVVANTILPHFISPKSRGPLTRSPYESGEVPVGGAWIQFDIHYYLFALVFLVFDVEAAFLFPVLVLFKGSVNPWLLFDVALFLVILSVPIFYAWRRGLFEWK